MQKGVIMARKAVFGLALAGALVLGLSPSAHGGLINGSFETPDLGASTTMGFAYPSAWVIPEWRLDSPHNILGQWFTPAGPGDSLEQDLA